MNKHNNSGKKSEPTSKQAKPRGPVRRDTKDVLAELVGKLKEKLVPKKLAATSAGGVWILAVLVTAAAVGLCLRR